MASASAFQTRYLRHDELDEVWQLIVDSGWHVSMNILKACHAVDSGGWFVLERRESGKKLGVISISRLNDDTAFSGMFMLGKKWVHTDAFEEVRALHKSYVGSRNCGTNANMAHFDRNLKFGFQCHDFDIHLFCGFVNHTKLPGPHVDEGVKFTVQKFDGSAKDLQDVQDYDTTIHAGIQRSEFTKLWLDTAHTVTYIARDEQERVTGFGCIQLIHCTLCQVGPVYAETPEIGRRIMTKLFLRYSDDKHIRVSIPVSNEASLWFPREFEWQAQETVRRLYTNEVLTLNLDKVFALSTLSFSLV